MDKLLRGKFFSSKLFRITITVFLVLSLSLALLLKASNYYWFDALNIVLIAFSILTLLWIFLSLFFRAKSKSFVVPPPTPVTQPLTTNTNELRKNIQENAGNVIFDAEEQNIGKKIFYVNYQLPDIKEFYGREREINIILKRVKNGASTSIIGPTGSGKTWLLRYMYLTIKNSYRSKARIGYINASMPSWATQKDFIHEVFKSLGSTLSDTKNIIAALEKLIARLLGEGYIIILFIDDFEALTKRKSFDADFFASLRSMASAGLSLVIASQEPLIDIVSRSTNRSSFFNIFEQILLEPFDEREARLFVKEKGNLAGFTSEEQEYLLKYGQSRKNQWPPLRLQLGGEILQQSKAMPEGAGVLNYYTDNQRYWKDFQGDLEKKFTQLVNS